MSMAEAAIELQPPNTIRGVWVALAVAAVGLALGPLAGMPNFVQAVVIEILIFSIMALSLDILVAGRRASSRNSTRSPVYGSRRYANRLSPPCSSTAPASNSNPAPVSASMSRLG